MLIPMILLALALQSVPAPAIPPVPQKFSVLMPPVGDEPCRPDAAARNAARETEATQAGRTPASDKPKDDDIVVCGNAVTSQTLPYPNEIVGGPTPVNPYANGVGALNAESTPCAARIGGCQVGFGPPIMPIAKALVGLAKDAFHKKPDKAGRIAIPLDDPPPAKSVILP